MKIAAIILAAALSTSMSSQAAVNALTKSEASAIITTELKREGDMGPKCFPMDVQSITIKGTWALVRASCHENLDAAMNAVLRMKDGAWKFACGHGDDVLYADKAMKRCNMTHAQALSLGFQDAPR